MTARRCAPLLAAALAACSGGGPPQPSHVTTAYRIKVDDAVREAASVELVTTKSVVISPNCELLGSGNEASVGRAIAEGLAARLPANVTIYTMPYVPLTTSAQIDVVTDDGYGGRLCTAHAFAPYKGS